jgi:fluoroacetyl-CoA thioesterase
MKPTLKPGLAHRFSFTVPENKTVPHLYPEARDFQAMPEVLATGFLVGLLEWTCIQMLQPHLDAGEGSLGIEIDVTHTAATPAGMTVTVEAELIALEGAKARFRVKAHDGIDEISAGEHGRFIVKWDKFNARLEDKRKKAAVA